MTTRQDKVNSLIKRELGKVLHEEGYYDISGLVTITKVFVTADLSEAFVSISVVGQDEGEVLQVFKKNIYEIQGLLNKRLVLRKLPKIKFVIDETSAVAQKINELIDEI